MIEETNINIEGHVKIWDPETQEVFLNKRNAINPETMSIAIANMLQGNNSNYVYEMHFGNGGAIIDETGNITYKDVTYNLNNGTVAALFNPTYYKVVDPSDVINNRDPSRNRVEVQHTLGNSYTDLVVTCTLEQDDPAVDDPGNLMQVSQSALDNASNFDGELVFNEIGLKSRDPVLGAGAGKLLTHIVFHPVQKSANRSIQVVYTLRIRIT